MRVLAFFFLLFALLPLKAATLSVNEIFVRLQGTIENGDRFEDLLNDLKNLENHELAELLKEFDLTWTPLKAGYLKDHEDFVTRTMTGDARREARARIKELRDDFFQIYQKEEGPMKPLLKTNSMPAIIALRELIMPTPQEVLATAPTSLDARRRIILVLAKFRDAVVDTAVLPDQERAEAGILSRESEVIAALGGLPREGLKIIKANDQIALKANIPAEEREGIRELNQWRLFLGLNALIIDPKLSEASRGHSEDMHEHRFFAHESPLPGKTTPWDRATNAGTKASGENIYMGSPSPHSANQGWFFSPGHHKNMFKASHLRIGLGRYQTHWTQMFG